MDEGRRKDVVQMLAEVKIEAEKRPKARIPREKKPGNSQDAKKKEGGAEVVYIKLDSQSGLVDALNAITQIKRSE